MHTLGKLMLLSHVLVQRPPLMEKHKLALLWGVHTRKPSNSSRFRESSTFPFIVEWNTVDNDFPEGELLQAF